MHGIGRRKFRLGIIAWLLIKNIFFSLTLFWAAAVATSYLSTLALSLGCIYSAKFLHDTLVHYTLRWPMELFDITPLGRIVNRFSKDVDTVDNTLPLNLRVAVMQLFAVI